MQPTAQHGASNSRPLAFSGPNEPAAKSVSRWGAAVLGYNCEDCLAVRSVVDCIAEVTRCAGDNAQCELPPNVATVNDAEHADDTRKWGPGNYAIDSFRTAVKCAYFDYQRHKVYVRTSPNLRKINRSTRAQTRKRNKASKSIEFRAYKCIRCKSHNISRNRKVYQSKLRIDLNFTSSGIRRNITKYCHAEHQCRDCGRKFVPPKYRRQKNYGHSLMSWCLYQHVVNRTTFEHIEATLAECFGVSLSFRRVHDFKSLAVELRRRELSDRTCTCLDVW